jgi:Fe-S cluster assembly ATP-binding protein
VELAQVFAMRPKLMILDEPDSGVDIDSLKLMGNEIRKVSEELGSSTLVITHHRHILRYLKVDRCHIMQGGRIAISGEPGEIIHQVEELGYEGYLKKVREE